MVDLGLSFSYIQLLLLQSLDTQGFTQCAMRECKWDRSYQASNGLVDVEASIKRKLQLGFLLLMLVLTFNFLDSFFLFIFDLCTFHFFYT